jgi:hypothetical protein
MVQSIKYVIVKQASQAPLSETITQKAAELSMTYPARFLSISRRIKDLGQAKFDSLVSILKEVEQDPKVSQVLLKFQNQQISDQESESRMKSRSIDESTMREDSVAPVKSRTLSNITERTQVSHDLSCTFQVQVTPDLSSRMGL